MFIALALLMVLGWVLGFTVMKVSSVAIHLLLLFAVVSVATHLIRGRARS